MKNDKPDLAQLCAPLSAKVMPKSATRSITGREMNASRALKAQRQSTGARFTKAMRIRGEKP